MEIINHENDKTIFRYLDPNRNDMLSKINDKELRDILLYLDRYYLEYRDLLGLSLNDTFGTEFEIEHFNGGVFEEWPFKLKIDELVGNDRWIFRGDLSLYNTNGREIVSEILTDTLKTWNDIKNVSILAELNSKLDINASSHVHGGAQILGDNSLYWYRLFKLWSIYENVIYRFCYGEYLTHRPKILNYARPAALFYDSRLSLLDNKLDCSLLEMLRIIEPKNPDERYTKKFGLSYWRMLCDNNYDLYEDFNKINVGCTLELRVPNHTLNEIIRQNVINFFIKFMLYCKSDRFDDDILNRRKIEVEGIFSDLEAYSKIYLEQALEFCDMIFDNNLDKVYFLRQYLKSFEIASKPLTKARTFTTKNIQFRG